ncbi:MAG: M16 family metallopeptidase [cyanobacterium endosymbiont of Rhopalodia musculus]|uniref:M16 family metallopeptidase n=1 Tax=cyanobacterium endosymbiont of Epithemia clementina EcSB TaxID=3034674 RepID=UPI0024802686|nr:pitrilysin family protein [cyanobacterium endosymbiont of Epithemia clementina EcSB]WGT68404.1 pitrilysin family protein [cyanobacterium endosymbiont of Epithemia clementina EcSB]
MLINSSTRSLPVRYSFATLSLLFFIWSSVPVIAQPLLHTSSTLIASQSITPYLNKAIEQITEFKLDNGMKFIVMENHDAPVVSFVTYADVGAVDEPDGQTGVAHFLEHLAFKGTKDIGTTNYAAEKPLLDQLDTLFSQMKAAQAAGKIKEAEKLAQEFQKVQTEANQYVQQNAFGQIVETAGGVGMNAATSSDWTTYFYSFPSNKLELWMSLESERFLEPVFREFYKEQDVILEERRLRTDNSPIGKMVEAFLDIAFTKHPYKRPVIGYNQDILGLTREDVRRFFETYYGPNNLTFAIVGDVSPEQVKQLAQVYFGRYSAKPKPPKVTKVEPQQTETKEVTLELLSQPWYLEGYHRPAITHPDHAVYEVMATLLSSGRTSRLYKSLVEEKKVALVAQGFNGFPGDKYPNLMLFYAQTAPNGTVNQVGKALEQEIERLKKEFVTNQELQRVKTQLRAALVRSLDSNLGMARSLIEYEVKTGSWRNLFDQLTAIEAVSAADIKRVAEKTFIPENRTIGRILSKTK